MEGQKKGRVGRPTTAPKEGVKATLGVRASATLKRRLDAAAKASARSLSAEMEVRLEQSFRTEDLLGQVLRLAYGPQIAALLMMIGRAMRIGERCALDATYSYDAIDRWLDVPYAANQAIMAAKEVLEGYRPPGDPNFPEQINGVPVKGGDRGRLERRGVDFADQLLRIGSGREVPPTLELEQFAAQVRPLLEGLEIRVPDDEPFKVSKGAGEGPVAGEE
jgi:hypothetical protein